MLQRKVALQMVNPKNLFFVLDRILYPIDTKNIQIRKPKNSLKKRFKLPLKD